MWTLHQTTNSKIASSQRPQHPKACPVQMSVGLLQCVHTNTDMFKQISSFQSTLFGYILQYISFSPFVYYPLSIITF